MAVDTGTSAGVGGDVIPLGVLCFHGMAVG